MITKDDADFLIEVLSSWETIRPQQHEKDRARAVVARLRDFIVDDEDEPETGELENVLTKVDVTTGELVDAGIDLDMAKHLAASEHVFVVEEGVRAGDVPPDELVFRKARS